MNKILRRALAPILSIMLVFLCFPNVYGASEKSSTSENQLAERVCIFKEEVEELIIEGEVNEPIVEEEVHTYYEGLCQDGDRYLLAKIVMAEAEGSGLDKMEHIVSLVLNRVKDDYFPNTVKDVIFQESRGVYQFSPIGNGRWDRVEPTENCYQAVDNVLEYEHDISDGATFFEDCKNPDNWHSRNLTFLYSIEGTRFYKI